MSEENVPEKPPAEPKRKSLLDQFWAEGKDKGMTFLEYLMYVRESRADEREERRQDREEAREARREAREEDFHRHDNKPEANPGINMETITKLINDQKDFFTKQLDDQKKELENKRLVQEKEDAVAKAKRLEEENKERERDAKAREEMTRLYQGVERLVEERIKARIPEVQKGTMTLDQMVAEEITNAIAGPVKDRIKESISTALKGEEKPLQKEGGGWDFGALLDKGIKFGEKVLKTLEKDRGEAPEREEVETIVGAEPEYQPPQDIPRVPIQEVQQPENPPPDVPATPIVVSPEAPIETPKKAEKSKESGIPNAQPVEGSSGDQTVPQESG